MLIRHIVAAMCVSGSVSLLSNCAIAEDPPVDLSSAGIAEVSEIGYTHGQDGSGIRDCDCDHDCNCGRECNCGPIWHWTGGVEATYLDPRFHASGNPLADPGLRLVDPGWTAAPRIWLGIENTNGWGARTQYWQLFNDQTRLGITNFQPDSIFDVTETLKMYDIDAEVTKRMELGNWNILGSFGGRFGSLQRAVGTSGLNAMSPADSFVYIFTNQTNAGGITGSLEMCRPIGIGSWEVFGLFRSSELWGETDALWGVRENNNGTPTSNSTRFRFASDLTIWEAQVGLQCSKNLGCYGTVLARCAFEYQSWIWTVPGGNPGNGAVFNPGADLYGVVFAVGFTR